MPLAPVKLCTVGLSCVLVLSACTGSPSFSLLPSNLFGEKPSASPAPSSRCATAETCAAELRRIVKSPKRDWVGQPQTPDAYANGTRLFAYRALRRNLSCKEIERALGEMHAARPSLEPARYARAQTLMSAVAAELAAEHGKRCRG
jgi:hypothetical protein